jgi:hypothetical protein
MRGTLQNTSTSMRLTTEIAKPRARVSLTNDLPKIILCQGPINQRLTKDNLRPRSLLTNDLPKIILGQGPFNQRSTKDNLRCFVYTNVFLRLTQGSNPPSQPN